MEPLNNARLTAPEPRRLRGWQILVTRPAAWAESLCMQLAAAGAVVHRAPMLTIEPVPETALQRALAQQLDRYDGVIVTSRHAVQYGIPLLAQFWPQWPTGQTWWAMGAATAAALAAHGIVAAAPDDARSEGLLARPEFVDICGQRILLLTGAGGRTLIDRTLAARGAEVIRLETYRRVDMDDTMPAALTIFRDTTAAPGQRAALVTSMEILRNLLARAPWLSALDMVLIVASERIAIAARTVGVRHVVNAGGADDMRLLAALGAEVDRTVCRDRG